jgi:hypothetical protein
MEADRDACNRPTHNYCDHEPATVGDTRAFALLGGAAVHPPLRELIMKLLQFVEADSDVLHIIETIGRDPDDHNLVWSRDDLGVEVARLLNTVLEDGWRLTK